VGACDLGVSGLLGFAPVAFFLLFQRFAKAPVRTNLGRAGPVVCLLLPGVEVATAIATPIHPEIEFVAVLRLCDRL